MTAEYSRTYPGGTVQGGSNSPEAQRALWPGLGLAVVGLYAVVAYLTSRRTREFALRLALGARRQETARLVAAETARTVAWGLGLGLAASLFLPQLLTALFGSMLFSPPLILAADAALVGAVAVLAALSPALRAMRADPVSALRYE